MPSQSMIRLLFVAAMIAPRAGSADECAGKVIYAGKDGIYLDAGRADGLSLGQKLSLARNGRKSGSVEITSLGDHIAAARDAGDRADIRAGDEFPCVAQKPAPAEKRSPSEVAPLSDDELPSLWTEALAANPRQPVHYEDYGAGDRPKAEGRVETYYFGGGYFGADLYTVQMQRLALWVDGDNIGLVGLGFAARGDLDMRYDSHGDHYLPGRRAVPLMRTLAIRYHSPRDRFHAAVGRVSPSASIAGIVDGGELGLRLKNLDVYAFGGLNPSMLDLAPRSNHQVFGMGLDAAPSWKKVDVGIDAAFLGETSNKEVDRLALAAGARLAVGSLFSASAAATVDFLMAHANAEGESGANLTDAALRAAVRPDPDYGIDLNVRYHDRVLFLSEMKDIDVEWITLIEPLSFGRADAGVELFISGQRSLRPFAFVYGDLAGGSVERGFTGGGLTYRNGRLFNSPVSFEATGDYGWGTGQKADLDLSLSAPLGLHYMYLNAGLYNAWHWQDGGDVSSLSHVAYLLVGDRVLENLRLFASLQGAYDHALVRLTHPQGGWLTGTAGASWQF